MPAIAFSAVVYLLLNLVALLLVLFVADLWLPQSIDRSIWPPLPPLLAAAIDIGLIALFGLQHSVMARAGFKRRLARLVPPPLERSLYVLVTSLVLAVLMLFWQPVTLPVWQVGSIYLDSLLWALFGLGWLIVVASTYMIDHWELFGINQTLRAWRGTAAPVAEFCTPGLYRMVRHPLYAGFLLAFWATPLMTAGHLLFATGMTVYVLVGMAHEERDLLRLFGDRYRDYRRRVPALLPGLKGFSPQD